MREKPSLPFKFLTAVLSRNKNADNLTALIPSGICRLENFKTSRIVFANDYYYKMFGYTELEARKAGFLTADYTVLPEDLSSMKEKVKKNFALRPNGFETEVRHVKKNGDIIWVLSRYTLDAKHQNEIVAVMIDITDRKVTEEKLRISEEEYRIAIRHSNKAILRYNIDSKSCYRRPESVNVFGLPSITDNIPDALIDSGLVAHDSVASIKSFFDAIHSGEAEGSVIVSMFDREAAEYKWYHFDFTSIFDAAGKPLHAIISFYDITQQRQKELAFQRWQQTYNAIPKNATNYFEYNLTEDIIENEAGAMIPAIPVIVPRKLSSFAEYIADHFVVPEDISLWLEFISRNRLLDIYSNGRNTDKTEFRRLSDDSALWTSVSVQLIPDPYSPNVKGYFVLEDIDEQKKAEIFLQERSMRDSLTGLLNRGSFVERFNEMLRKSDLETQHALIMLDIDNFKKINDSLGHSVGDALLINIAGKLKYALRADDLCGRLGGDEFVICLKHMNLGKPLETRISYLCNLICSEQSFGVKVSASFGVAGFPYDGLTFEELYEKADIALYKAKADGRGRYTVYDPQLSLEGLPAARSRH